MDKKEMKINVAALSKALERVASANTDGALFKPPTIPDGVGPKNKREREALLAQDSACYNYMNNALQYSAQYTFMGYPLLAELSQQPEYRSMAETIAKEATRKFGLVKGPSERAKVITAALKKYKVRKIIRRVLEQDGLFGRGQIFIDTGAASNALPEPLVADKRTFKKGSLRGFRTIEPLWTYPAEYNSDNPLSPNFYAPQQWYVMAQRVHKSRLLTVVSREVSDILKPAYLFGGLSLTQMARPYVDNWLRTRDSVGDLLHAFSLTILGTDMSSILSGDCGDTVFSRLDLFNRMRDNRGAMVIDKEGEEITQHNTPLTTLDALQAQAQEQMASVSHIPLIKLLGISPTGLNATSDGEIRSFYDWIHSLQEDVLNDPMRIILDTIQINEFGDIDPEIEWEWVPLWQMDDSALATIRKTNAETDSARITDGIISPEEARERLVSDPNSGYFGLKSDVMPERVPTAEELLNADPATRTDE